MKRINGRAIIIDGDEVLLMFRRKIKDGIVNEYYAIPGGGKEENETIEECVIREIKEEFNLDIEERKATYLLKEKNMSFDIDVEKIEYKKENNKIVLEYKISSDEETFKIEINEEDDINE